MDVSGGAVRLNGEARYKLQGDPRRRVITLEPKLNVQIWFGKRVAFRFRWQLSLDDPRKVDEWRARLSRSPAAITDATKGAVGRAKGS